MRESRTSGNGEKMDVWVAKGDEKCREDDGDTDGKEKIKGGEGESRSKGAKNGE